MTVKVTRKKKQRKPTVKALKAKIDKTFSDYIRQRGMDEKGMATCVCCGTQYPWQRIQCGHYCRRVHLATRWSEVNCFPVCYACNVLRRGNYASMAVFMYDRFSKKQMTQLVALSQQKVKLTVPYLLGVLERVRKLSVQSIANGPLKK